MLKLLTLFLTTLILSSCATAPKAQPFEADWEFRDGLACMKKEDVIKLRVLLHQCSDGSKN